MYKGNFKLRANLQNYAEFMELRLIGSIQIGSLRRKQYQEIVINRMRGSAWPNHVLLYSFKLFHLVLHVAIANNWDLNQDHLFRHDSEGDVPSVLSSCTYNYEFGIAFWVLSTSVSKLYLECNQHG